jgi:putative transposase
MKNVRVYRLNHLSSCQLNRLKASQKEVARVWNVCMELHEHAQMTHIRWASHTDGPRLTEGRFALYSQSVQAIFRPFLATIDTTPKLRKTHAQMKYPWRGKRFYPVHWSAQAVNKKSGRVFLPMGRGQASLVLPLALLPSESGAYSLVWNYGIELHTYMEVPQAEYTPGNFWATVDLEEIHLPAVTKNTAALSDHHGRGICFLKRQLAKQLGRLDQKHSRCMKHSPRCWKKLQRAKNKHNRRTEWRIRDSRHKAMRQIIDFCIESLLRTLFKGNTNSVRQGNKGRPYNQRMALWEYGRDIDSLTKDKVAHILTRPPPNEVHRAGALHVGIIISPRTETVPAVPTAFRSIAISSVRSIRIRFPLVGM